MEQVLNSYGKERLKAFQELCSADMQSVNIKKLFLKVDFRHKLDSEVLTHGLMGALENGQEKYISIISDFMVKNAIKPEFSLILQNLMEPIQHNEPEVVQRTLDYLDKSGFEAKDSLEDLQLIFNCATANNNMDLAYLLDEKYAILNKSMTSPLPGEIILSTGAHFSFASLNGEGFLDISGCMGGECTRKEIEIAHYQMNPILFNLKHFNAQLLDDFLKRDGELEPCVVTHGLVSNIYWENREAVLYMFSNEKCLNVINASPHLKSFLSHEQFSQEKKEARMALMMTDFSNKLEDNHQAKNKVKL